MGRDDAGQADLDHGGGDDHPGAGGGSTLAYPTNLALMRDGTYAYVGVGNTDQIVGINTSQLAEAGTVTLGVNPCPGGLTCSGIPATTSITVGVHTRNCGRPADLVLDGHSD